MAKTLLVVLQQILIRTTHKRAERLVFLCVVELKSLLRPLRALARNGRSARRGVYCCVKNKGIFA